MPSASASPSETSLPPCGTVLVTGIDGFIGSHVAAAFAAKGWQVRGTTRRVRGRGPGRPVPAGAEIRQGRLDHRTEWASLLDGVDVVVHLAARVHDVTTPVDDPEQGYWSVNVNATDRLARQAARSGVRRIVYLSSIGVNGHSTGERAFTTGDPALPVTPYARSKWQAEQLLVVMAEAGAFQLVRLRFPLVYGPRAPGNFGRLLRLIATRIPLPFASIRNRRSLLYVENAADVLARAAEHPAAAGRLFLAADREEVSTPDLIRRLAELSGIRAHLFPVRVALLRALGRAIGRSEEVAGLVNSLRVDSSDAHTTLQWTPPWSLDQGLARSVGSS